MLHILVFSASLTMAAVLFLMAALRQRTTPAVLALVVMAVATLCS